MPISTARHSHLAARARSSPDHDHWGGPFAGACVRAARGWARALTVALPFALAACGPSPPTGDASAAPPIAATWRRRCGQCHVRPEPGLHTHDELVTAFSRHRTRLKLSEDQWSQMVTFLEKPAPAAP